MEVRDFLVVNRREMSVVLLAAAASLESTQVCGQFFLILLLSIRKASRTSLSFGQSAVFYEYTVVYNGEHASWFSKYPYSLHCLNLFFDTTRW